jgi:hypothetical protein
MSKEFAVYFENVLIVAKQVAYLAYGLAVGGCHATDPGCGFAALDVGEADILRAVGDHWITD